MNCKVSDNVRAVRDTAYSLVIGTQLCKVDCTGLVRFPELPIWSMYAMLCTHTSYQLCTAACTQLCKVGAKLPWKLNWETKYWYTSVLVYLENCLQLNETVRDIPAVHCSIFNKRSARRNFSMSRLKRPNLTDIK